MSDENTEDGRLAGSEGPAERQSRTLPSWVIPIGASVVGGFFILLNGWFAYIASTSKELMEARNDALTKRLDDMKDRIDRIDDRVIFLEQNRTGSTTATTETSGIALAVPRRQHSSTVTTAAD